MKEKETVTKEDVGALTPVDSGAAALALMNAELAGYEAGIGTDFSPTEIGLPFLKVLQSNSPEVKEEVPERYVEGAKPGMVINTITKRLYDVRQLQGKPEPAPIPVVFADRFSKRDTEWRPDRGGFAGKHHPPNTLKFKEDVDGEGKTVRRIANGNVLIETDYHFPIILENDPDDLKRYQLGMSSSQLTPSREISNFVNEFKVPAPPGFMIVNPNDPTGPKIPAPVGHKIHPPIFFMVFALRTKTKTKDQNTWWVWDAKFVGLTTEVMSANPGVVKMVHAAAKSYYDDIRADKVLIVPPTEDVKQDVPF